VARAARAVRVDSAAAVAVTAVDAAEAQGVERVDAAAQEVESVVRVGLEAMVVGKGMGKVAAAAAAKPEAAGAARVATQAV
jgi:hypothetical protein